MECRNIVDTIIARRLLYRIAIIFTLFSLRLYVTKDTFINMYVLSTLDIYHNPSGYDGMQQLLSP